MTDAEFLTAVRERMDALAASQTSVANACGLSQAHLSKVLAGRVGLASKTRFALARWLTMPPPSGSSPGPSDLEDLIDRLRSRDPERVMQIMQLLRIIDGLVPH